ncbi:ABC transporter ATP-binding protein [Weissella cibaria]|uniref:ABC transporter ATP-binding protein n=1 Tax=Weissella cibaria TaxID=137591 RepID=UPI00119002E9|nr:ABC transporter ATP-binding protein [Weissella cibaria]TVV34639.1 ABC transporter ATP-binding protein [Weissella cibaria]
MMNRGRMSPAEVKAYLKESDTTLGEMLKFVFGSVLKRKSLLVLNVALLVIIAGLNFVVPQFTQHVIDHAVALKNIHSLAVQVGLLILTTLALGVVTFMSTYLMQMLSQRSITDLRLQTYNRILKQDYDYFQNAKTGDLMVRLTSDISNLQNLISSDSFGIIGNIFTFVAVLTFLFLQDWQLALMVTVTFPVLFVTIRYFRSKIREAYTKVRATSSQISNQLQGTITEIELIKSYTTEDEETARFRDVVEAQNGYQLEATRWQAIFQPLVNFINTVGTAIVLAFGGWLIIKGHMTVGQLVAYLSYLSLLQDPIRSFSRLLNMLQTAQVSYDRIKDIMGAEEKIKNASEPVAFPSPLQTGIDLQNVSFSYDQERVASLNGINLLIPAGKTTALVGRSGAGKSTLIRLLTRFYERTGGDILFDDTKIEAIDIRDLRQHISIVSQDVTIVDGTIADNIRYGSGEVSDDKLWDAAERAAIADFIRGLPDGMATTVGERGVKLSGGQKQRLSIARALVKDAEIVILDEATAALDNESEKIIQHALDNLMTHKTTIVIAHRLSTVHNADQIVVLNEGEIVERGSHNELLAQNGVYKTLYDAQFE